MGPDWRFVWTWLGVVVMLGACAPEGEKAPPTGGDDLATTGTGTGGETDDGPGGSDGGDASSPTAGSASGGGGTGGGSAGGGSGDVDPTCGDAVLDADEECDNMVFDELVCEIDNAVLVCNADCSIDMDSCCAPAGSPCVVAVTQCCNGCDGLLGECM